MERTLFQQLQIWFIKQIASIQWRPTRPLTLEDNALLKEKFAKDYYIIATRKGSYLTTFFIALGNFFLTGKWGFYSHVLMNLEDAVKTDDDFRFIEATSYGTHFSTYPSVFDSVDAVALIKPRHMALAEWTAALDSAKIYLGRPYDNLFDLKNDLEINCVELIRLALQGTDNYATNFSEFEKLILQKKTLTPDMFVNCSDFDVVFVIMR